ncbi:MAG: HD domain-containing protein [Defluviitaleaceae bacterium]|nr:HD domain-containing protein [Defluviitaleaceae bacterium]
MTIPTNVTKIINTLANSGYEAYIVGGCVRDSMLGYSPKDWDIATNATPAEMCTALSQYKLVPTGEKYGTMTVLIGKNKYEVTTYRADGTYSDGRRPDQVTFSRTLKDDLCRRDFTINAMAYNDQTGLVDLFGGADDINNKIIRCVGNPCDRFNEDSLRIMRAIRFACRLDFDISKCTISAIWDCGENLKNVSQERITAELVQILQHRKKRNRIMLEYIIKRTIPEFLALAQVAHNNPYHYTDVFTHTIDALFHCTSTDTEILLALLFHDIGKQKARTFDEKRLTNHYKLHPLESAAMCKEILTRMKLDNKTLTNVCKLVKYHDWDLQPTKKIAKKSLNKLGYELCIKLLEVKLSDRFAHRLQPQDFAQWSANLAQIKGFWDEIIANNEAFAIADLAINGNDLMEMGFPQGKILGELLQKCLDYVMDNPDENSKTALLAYVSKLRK